MRERWTQGEAPPALHLGTADLGQGWGAALPADHSAHALGKPWPGVHLLRHCRVHNAAEAWPLSSGPEP